MAFNKGIYAKTKKGPRLHGRIDQNMFVRTIEFKDLKIDGRMFCVNMSVMPELEKEGVGAFKFILCTKRNIFTYKISVKDAFEIGNIVEIDDVESNLRILMDEVPLESQKLREGALPAIEPEKENPQKQLF
jgi:hypothetical protein